MNNVDGVLVDCERMKYPYTGLYYYCLHLGKALMNADDTRKKFCFYVPSAAKNVFGINACYLKQSPFDKFSFPSTQPFSLWHSTYQGTNYFPWKQKIKVLLTIHDLNFMYDQSKSLLKKKLYLKKLALKVDRADHIVAISHFTLQDLKKYINIDSKPCTVVYNGCTINEINGTTPPSYIPKAPFIFTIGTIVEKKNFHVLPALLVKNDMQLVIAGITQSQDYKNLIIAEAKRLGVSDRIVFTGSISDNDKQWYLKNCVAFTFPSISEGFGLPVIEAMHFGKPVLLSDATSLPEVGGNEAYYFRNFEPGHMMEVADKALAENTGQKAVQVKEWAKKFNWETSAQKYLQLYSDLLSNRKG